MATRLTIMAILLAAGACAGAAPSAYGAERLACVGANDAAAAARECMRAVDAKYGQGDGGAP